jgi:hypothetical protein
VRLLKQLKYGLDSDSGNPTVGQVILPKPLPLSMAACPQGASARLARLARVHAARLAAAISITTLPRAFSDSSRRWASGAVSKVKRLWSIKGRS